MLQKDAKLIFISSSNSSDQSTSFLYKLKNAHEKMLNIVSYVCNEHKEEFSLQDCIVSCPCYSLYIPSYITINEQIKNTTNMFLDGVFATELMGDVQGGKLSAFQVVSEASISQFEMCRLDTTAADVEKQIHSIAHMYIDPAFTNNTDASGTGIAIVGCLGGKTKVLLGCEHFFLQNLTGTATLQIAACASSLIKSVSILHPNIKTVRVSIEGNSNQDCTVAIANYISECSPVEVLFHHQSDKMQGVLWPMYLLGSEKSKAFESFIYAINTGHLKASQSMVSHTIKLSYDPVCYLIEQIRAIKCQSLRDGRQTYHAKQKHMSDDLLIAVVMSLYLSESDAIPFKPLNNTKKFF